MAPIRILSDQVANQIAAGEVIERPASVVKELLENSLDAGATRVEVAFRHGGKSFLSIEDDGSGMSPDDALMALERHATSKLVEAKDLSHIRSFGFRGEALPSIASVSRFTLQTRPATQTEGSEIVIDGGKALHQRAHGMPPGTRIVVEQLFNSVPARRKFLRTDNTESAHIIQCVRLYAAANPEVAFTLREDTRVLFRSPKGVALLERVCAIWGQHLSEELIELPVSTEGDLSLRGLLGKPGVCRANRAETLIFVNRRPVDCRALTYALLEAYHTRVPKGKYPPAILFFDADPARIDVNVHPAKREIRLKDEWQLRRFVTMVVAKALGGPIPEISDRIPAGALRPQLPTEYQVASPVATLREPPANASHHGLAVRSEAAIPPPTAIAPQKPPLPAMALAQTPPPIAAVLDLAWRPIGRWRAPYWLFDSPQGLILLNTRAAHRRIVYEQFLRKDANATLPQQLLMPILIALDPLSCELLNEALPLFQGQGFVLEAFGSDTWRLSAVPSWLAPQAGEAFVRDAVAILRKEGFPRSLKAREEALAQLAGSKAIRRDDDLSLSGAHVLAAELMRCENPHTTPDGKPTYIAFTQGDLDRRFG